MPIDWDAYRERKAREETELIAQMRESNRQHWAQVCRQTSEIGDRFAERTLRNYRPNTAEQRAAFEHALAIAGGAAAPAAYFWGKEPGTGKTHLAAGIANALCDRGVPVVFVTGVGLVQRIRDSYGRTGKVREGERDIIDRLARVDVLVLDDLGTEPFTADTGRLFYALLNTRYERNLALIVTSNLSMADLGIAWSSGVVEAHIGRKLIDRLREMCGRSLHVDGQSRRGVA